MFFMSVKSCFSSQSVYCYAFRARSRERYFVCSNERLIALFCYNVSILVVLYKIKRRVYIANRFSSKITDVTIDTSTFYKPDASLRRTVRAAPEGVSVLESVDCTFF